MTRARKWLLGVGIAIVAVIALLAIALAWLFYTPSGLSFALTRGVSVMHGQFDYSSASGTLAGTATIDGLYYRNDDDDVLRVTHATIDLQPWALLAGRLHVRRARIDGLDLTLGTAKGSSGSRSLQPPLTVVMDDTQLTDIVVRQSGKQVFAANTLAIAGLWSKRQLLIRQLDLRAPEGSARLAGVIALAPGFSGHGTARLDWRHDDTRYVAAIETQSDGSVAQLQARMTAPVDATLSATLKLDASHAWTMALDAPKFDVRAVPALPDSMKTLALALRGAGTGAGGKLQGSVAINDQTMLIDPAQFNINGKTVLLDPLRLSSPQIPGIATATGTIHLDTSPITAVLKVEWHDVLLPQQLAGQELATHGALNVSGSAQSYALDGALAIGPPGRLSNLQLALTGTPAEVALRTLKLVQKNGGLGASGTIGLQPRVSWKLDVLARKFDPGALLAGWNGALDFSLATQGEMTQNGPQATLKLDRVAGSLRQRSVAGSRADLRITPENLLDGNLLLAVGRSRISAQGQAGPRTNAVVTLDIASLSDWLPEASGTLTGRFTLRGAWPKLAIVGNAQGKSLSRGTQRIDALELSASIPDISRPGGDFDLALTGVQASGLEFDTAKIEARGTAASHRVHLDVRGPQLDASLALQGSWQAKTKSWSGTLHDASLTPEGLPEWRQQQQAALSWRNGVASLAQLCLSAGEPSLCITADRKANGTLDARYHLQHLPLQLLATLASDMAPLRASGELSGSGQLTLRADGGIDGNADLQASPGAIAFASNPDNSLLAWTELGASVTANGQTQHVRLHGNLRDGGSLNGDVSLSGSDHALGGSISADLRSLAFLEALSAEIANVHGSLAGTLTLGGTLAAPQFQGNIHSQDFSAELPRAGLKLRDGRFAITGDAQGRLRIEGQAISGKGTLQVNGTAGFSAAAPLTLVVRGENVLVADIPAAHVIASPELRIGRAQGLYTVTGTLGIPQARIEVEKLPGEGAVKPSPDVVVVDETQPQKAAVAEFPMQADITVTLGDNVSVKGFGLDGKVRGALAVHAQPTRAATGRGQIQVDGTYRAYGQNLQIQRGRLLFAGTRLDNPGLDIRATRQVRSGNVTVGLSVRGTAQQPILSVFSDPAMQQSQALSYLVTGRPLESLRSGEADTLNTAAQALGGLAGDRLAKSLGSRLGLETGVSGSDALGGSAFTAGKYLSPRLFISYGVGLFTPGQVITLRYTINRFLQFEAENATTGNRASLNYRIEK